MIHSETELSDTQLIERFARSGDTDAFSALQRRYGRMVYATCLRELGNAPLAEDAAQGAFLLLSREANRLTRHACLAGWLFQSAMHISRNLARQERRRVHREQQAMKDVLNEEHRDEAWQLVAPELNGALETLSPLDRNLILLRFVQEVPLTEVGQRVGLSENAARMRVSRALERMAKVLRRRGVVLSAAFLGVILSERATARELPVPTPEMPNPSAQVLAALPKTSWLAGLSFPLPPLVGVIVATTAGAAFWFTRTDRLPAVSESERKEIFSRSAGTWSGTLEYADDQTKAIYTYPTDVVIEQLGSNGLRLTARYQGSSSVDITNFLPRPDGKFTIENGGGEASHELDGVYDFVHLPNGQTAFRGVSPKLTREVQLTFNVQSGSTVIEEQYRRPNDATWQFRNRYSLKRGR